ncbi:MAG: GNAT family N-acetyltransferase, partial [Candidatus Thermoplasmatota archaeon]|nr:GNAT family N-acetyltransferase [Candidatus Thermoplasmatota archaeon]
RYWSSTVVQISGVKPPWARRMPYEQYRERWSATSQPDSFISDMMQTMKDDRTIAEILEDDADIVGYIWVSFSEIQDYDLIVAEVMDIVVAPDYQHRGIGLKLMKRVERLSLERGATLLRSDTGIENMASQRLHEKAGLKPYRIIYEKVLQEKTI